MTESRTVRCEHCGHVNRVPSAAQGRPRCGECRQPLPWIVDSGDHDFAEVAEHATIPVLVDMWAPWCGPCRMVSPALEQLAQEFAGRLKLVKVDVDKAPALSQRFTVQAVPTLMVLDHGEEVARQAGAAPVPVLRRWVEDALAGRQPIQAQEST
ncbi:thioredoxin [Amycolatopsis thermoflava]|uniref:thioredoxin n=1 Tax=Amycolatopsis thermoflava TaxID=84480 RepID=UPI003F4A2FEF